MAGDALGVRPRAYVHLGWSAQTGNHLGGPRQQRTHLSGLGAGQVGNVEDVALGLDNEGAHAEGPDAVLDQPVVVTPPERLFERVVRATVDDR